MERISRATIGGPAFAIRCIGIAAALSLVAGPALAGKVDLSGLSAVTTGKEKIKISDGPKCKEAFSLTVSLGVGDNTFSALDENLRSYTGTYKQKKPQGRKLVFKLDSASRNTLLGALEDYAADCLGVGSVDGTLKSLKVKGKINKAVNKIKVTGKVKGEGESGGDSGSATYSFKTKGPFVLD